MFRRISNLFRGFLSLFISGLEKENPEALLEVEKENLRKQIAQYNQGLASHAGLCEKLISTVRQLETQERDLKAKTTALLRANARDAAGQAALHFQNVTRQLADARGQMEAAEKTYKELLKSRDVAVKAAQDKIEKLKYALDDLKIKKATAELNEMASGMITEIGGAGDTLNRLHDMVEEERQKASGRARVARDSMDMSEINLKAAEQQALADSALADFAAAEGIALDSPAAAQSAPAATKQMGQAEGQG
jgi:phage shock protein A